MLQPVRPILSWGSLRRHPWPQDRGGRGTVPVLPWPGPCSPRLAKGLAAPPLTAALPLQAKQEQEEGMAYYGKVTFPCPPGHSQAHRLLLTPELLHKLQSHFVS